MVISNAPGGSPSNTAPPSESLNAVNTLKPEEKFPGLEGGISRKARRTPTNGPPAAESTMCKRCSDYVDLRDYLINSAVSKNFRTHGRFPGQPAGGQ